MLRPQPREKTCKNPRLNRFLSAVVVDSPSPRRHVYPGGAHVMDFSNSPLPNSGRHDSYGEDFAGCTHHEKEVLQVDPRARTSKWLRSQVWPKVGVFDATAVHPDAHEPLRTLPDARYVVIDVIQPMLAIYPRPPLLHYCGPVLLTDGCPEEVNASEEVRNSEGASENASVCSETDLSTDEEDGYQQVVLEREGGNIRIGIGSHCKLEEGVAWSLFRLGLSPGQCTKEEAGEVVDYLLAKGLAPGMAQAAVKVIPKICRSMTEAEAAQHVRRAVHRCIVGEALKPAGGLE